MKRSLLVELIVALLILLFAYTATSKFFEFSSFRYVLSRSPLTGILARVVACISLILESLIIVRLLIAAVRKWTGWILSILKHFPAGYIGYYFALPLLIFFSHRRFH